MWSCSSFSDCDRIIEIWRPWSISDVVRLWNMTGFSRWHSWWRRNFDFKAFNCFQTSFMMIDSVKAGSGKERNGFLQCWSCESTLCRKKIPDIAWIAMTSKKQIQMWRVPSVCDSTQEIPAFNGEGLAEDWIVRLTSLWRSQHAPYVLGNEYGEQKELIEIAGNAGVQWTAFINLWMDNGADDSSSMWVKWALALSASALSTERYQ